MGSSGHVHLSVAGEDGDNLFDPDGQRPVAARPALHRRPHAPRAGVHGAGLPVRQLLQAARPGELRDGRRSTSAREGRTTPFRVCGHGASRNVEYRIPGADGNPYLVLAAMLAAGLDGIEHGAEPFAAGTAEAARGRRPARRPARRDRSLAPAASGRVDVRRPRRRHARRRAPARARRVRARDLRHRAAARFRVGVAARHRRAGGIGLATARRARCATAYDVVVADVLDPPADLDAAFVRCDLSDLDASSRRCARRSPASCRCSSTPPASSSGPTSASTPMPELERVYAVNMRAPLFLIQGLSDRFGAGSAIVNVASMEATDVVASTGRTTPIYASTKAALKNLTETLAAELGAARHPRQRRRAGPDRDAADAGIPSETRDWFIRLTPLGDGFGQPEDVADVIAFLASGDARFVTGVCVAVDGGMSLGLVAPLIPGARRRASSPTGRRSGATSARGRGPSRPSRPPDRIERARRRGRGDEDARRSPASCRSRPRRSTSCTPPGAARMAELLGVAGADLGAARGGLAGLDRRLRARGSPGQPLEPLLDALARRARPRTCRRSPTSSTASSRRAARSGWASCGPTCRPTASSSTARPTGPTAPGRRRPSG